MPAQSNATLLEVREGDVEQWDAQPSEGWDAPAEPAPTADDVGQLWTGSVRCGWHRKIERARRGGEGEAASGGRVDVGERHTIRVERSVRDWTAGERVRFRVDGESDVRTGRVLAISEAPRPAGFAIPRTLDTVTLDLSEA